ncbi:MAG: L-lactate permease [Acidithiobacillus sp.]|nr:L-lactate permease [Acidithiobacillus sp.]
MASEIHISCKLFSRKKARYFWLLIVALGYGWSARLSRPQWQSIGTTLWKAGRISVAVTLLFVIMTQLLADSGIAAALARSWILTAGSAAVLASPMVAAVAGVLSGSNVASNAMLMPLQTALASHSGLNPDGIAAMQNTAGSNFKMLSASGQQESGIGH